MASTEVWKDKNDDNRGVELVEGDESSGDDSDSSLELDSDSETESSSKPSLFKLARSHLSTCDMQALCATITEWWGFWFLVTLMIVSEPIIVSWNPYDEPTALVIAGVVVGISTILLIIQVVSKTKYMTDDWVNKKREESLGSKKISNRHEPSIREKTFLRLKHVLLSGSFILEFACILCGWVFLYYRPGIATLRCFRAFRILWYHELPSDVLETLKNVLSYGLGRELVDLMFRVMKFATRSLSHLGQEMLFLTKKSRGGFILMFMLFYIAYVLGATMWIETAHSNLGDFCLTLGSCTYTMIRLTFFDGNGFDFAYSLVEGHPILFGITCLYLCVTSFGIVNGLIGVFGDIFKDDSDKVFETNKEEEGKAQRKENEHFQRYNNTAESLILVQMQLQDLSKKFENMEAMLKKMAAAKG